MRLPLWLVRSHADVTRLGRGRLFRKYFGLILAFVCGALIVSGGIGLYFSYQENQRALAVLQREKAVAAAARVEEFLFQIEQQLKYAALPQLGIEGLEQRRIEFLKLLRQADAVTDVAQIDARGREQISESRLKMSEIGTQRDWSQEAAFKNARPGQTWFGPVYFRKETEPYMSIAVRGSRTGPVTVADVNLKFIWEVVQRIRVGEKGKAYVIDRTGLLVADPDIGLVLRKTDLSGLEQVKAALDTANDEIIARQAHDLAGTRVLSAHAPIELREDRDGRKREPLGWKVFVEQPLTEVYAGLQATIMRTGGLVAAGLLFSVLAAMWLAGTMVRPIRTLQDGAARIGEGDLDTQINVKTGDELQGLAEQFNRMTAQLRESYAGLERKVDARTAELQETLDQQTATSEILRVISSSTTDVQPVFDAIVAAGARLFAPCNAVIVMREGDFLHRKARCGPTLADASASAAIFPLRFDPQRSPMSRAIAERRTIEITDIQSPEYDAKVHQLGRAANMGAGVLVPLVRDGEGIGVCALSHPEAGFKLNDKQLALLRTFADQAVIAIENVRLFNETKEALEQQTATSEILRIISSSPSDLTPVFRAILAKATSLCEAAYGVLWLREGDSFRMAALHGALPAEQWRTGMQVRPSPDVPLARVVQTRKSVHIVDMRLDHGYMSGAPLPVAAVEVAGMRTLLLVPMLKENEVVGEVAVYRTEVRAFTERQIALIENFADQAVIAIENVRLFREIQDKSRQLEIANKHKSDFLANMSHELRTPLNAIIGFSEVLSERMFGELNEKQADYMKDIHESGKHLLSLINDILDLSKIEAGRMDLEVSSFNLPAALSNAMTLVRERAQRHGIALDLQIDKHLAEFNADERKFKQILLNLLSNAVKFTPDGGRVDVSAKLNGKAAEFAVRDTGIGIAAEDQEKVFAEFVQVGRDYTRKAEGTGLGLALTKRFVELHGGEIRLESAPGKGSTFTFTLPIRQ
ncbi:MAG TPA: ATP-binding protein [Burkholderiales bacterium]|nr:ATP-binding protein [Burkholderiales bacterium]